MLFILGWMKNGLIFSVKAVYQINPDILSNVKILERRRKQIWPVDAISKHLKSHLVPHVSDFFADGSFRAHRE